METVNNLTREFVKLNPCAVDITGQRYGRLVAIGPVGSSKNYHVQWLCKCDCGTEIVTEARRLRHRGSLSCGCHLREQGKRIPERHGLSGSPVYHTWIQMLVRCHYQDGSNYLNYGGRGISVCDEWRNSFAPFEEYVSKLPNYQAEGFTLDRIDNDGNYEPGNVRWATPKQQMRNTRRNRFLSFNGKTQCLVAWAEETGISDTTILLRIKRGWSIDAALGFAAKTKIKKDTASHNAKLISFKGKTQSISGWSDELGIKRTTLIYRLKNGWSLERVFAA